MSAARTPIGRFQGGLASFSATDLGGLAVREALRRVRRARRCRGRGDHGQRAAGGRRAGPGAAGGAQGRRPRHRSGPHREHGLRLRAAGGHAGGQRDRRRAGRSRSSPAAWRACRTRPTSCRRRAPATGSATASSSTRWSTTASGAPSRTGTWEWPPSSSPASSASPARSRTSSRSRATARRSRRSTPGSSRPRSSRCSVPQKKGDPIVVDTDESPRRDTTLESLAKLKPAFEKDGTVTAGNAPSVNDGAAALVVASGARAKELGLKPMARITGYASGGTSPEMIFYAPVVAVRKLHGEARARRSATTISSRRTRRSRPRRWSTGTSWAGTGRASTSTAARSPSGTRSAPAARGSSSPCCTP